MKYIILYSITLPSYSFSKVEKALLFRNNHTYFISHLDSNKVYESDYMYRYEATLAACVVMTLNQ